MATLTSSSPLVQSINYDYMGRYRGNICLYKTSETHVLLSEEIQHWLASEIRGFRPLKVQAQDDHNYVGKACEGLTGKLHSTGRLNQAINPDGCCIVLAEQMLGPPGFQLPLLCLTDGPSNILTVFMPKRAKLSPGFSEKAPEKWHLRHSVNEDFVYWSQCLE